MTELVQRLKDEGTAFESAVGPQRAAIESAVAAVGCADAKPSKNFSPTPTGASNS